MSRLLAILLFALLTLRAAGAGPSVWVASPWEHVLKSSPPGTGREVRLEAAANEFESCRIIVRAIEDYEYMALAAKRGHKAEVDAIVTRLSRSFQDWEKDPGAYASARAELARLIP